MPETKSFPMGVTYADVSKAMNMAPQFQPKLDTVQLIKRGDPVKVMVQFRPDTPSEGNPQPRAYEVLPAFVLDRQSPIVTLKIASAPQYTHKHGLGFEDVVTAREDFILYHESATAEQVKAIEHLLTGVVPAAQPVNEEDRKLREAVKNLPPLAPEVGKRYWLRNGLLANVWTFLSGENVYLGNAPGWDQLRWNQIGASTTNRDFDIVKDPSANEVLR